MLPLQRSHAGKSWTANRLPLPLTVFVDEDTRLQLLPPQMLAEMDGGSVLCSPGELAGWFHKRSFACLLGQPVMAYGTQPK